MKQRTSIALHVAALAALSVAAGCQTVQPRGNRGSLFGGKAKPTPTEGEIVEPGKTEVRTKPATPETPAPVAVEQPKFEEFSIPVDDVTTQKKPVLAKDIKTEVLPKPDSDAEPMKTPVPVQPAGAPALPKIVKKYTVAKGDTFGGIAQKHGLTSAELARVNSLNDINKVRVGQVLNIPEAGPRAPKAASKKSAVVAPAGGSVYTVKAGDYIGKIAHQHGLKTGDVLRANGLSEESAKKIKVGQQLIIPAKTSDNAFTPKAADKAADKPAKPVAPVIKPAAPVAPAPAKPTPVPFKEVTIPAPAPAEKPAKPVVAPAPAPVVPVVPAVSEVKPEVAAPVVPSVPVAPALSVPAAPVVPAVPAASAALPRTYTVQAGDSIATVAAKHNTTKMIIMSLNGMSLGEEELKPGQVIKVP